MGGEELVRRSGLDYTVIKAGMIYGRGDHLLDHLSHWLHTAPFLPTVGPIDRPIRPLAIEDLVRIIRAALLADRLSRRTVAATGPEEVTPGEVARRIARVRERRARLFRLPVWAHLAAAQVFEWTMAVPLTSRAQVRILAEGAAEPPPEATPLPDDLLPVLDFSDAQIRRGLPGAARFGLGDMRCAGRLVR